MKYFENNVQWRLKIKKIKCSFEPKEIKPTHLKVTLIIKKKTFSNITNFLTITNTFWF